MQHSFAVTNPHAQSRLIIVMGVSGSGKTTVAKALAEHYNYDYRDGDDFHSDEARALMANGTPLTDDIRWPWVLRMRDHFRRAAEQQQNSTLAFSGLRKAHRNELRNANQQTVFVFLYSDKATIQERVNNRAGHFMSPTLVDSQFSCLEEPTDESDIIRVNVAQSIESVISEAIRKVDAAFAGHMTAATAD
jgi:gluconokinase